MSPFESLARRKLLTHAHRFGPEGVAETAERLGITLPELATIPARRRPAKLRLRGVKK